MLRRRRHSDFHAEIEAHIALEAYRLRGEGLSQADAEAAARRSFGNATAAEERFYESGRWLWWDEVRSDVRYALRTLRHSPAFAAAAVLTLALGIGANTAIFSVIDAVLLRPLPYPHPDRIVMLYGRVASGENSELSPATFLDFRRQSRSFEHLAGFRQSAVNVTGQDRPERIEGAVVTPDFFAVLGVQAQLGRTLTAAQDRPGAARTVVLSDSLWHRRYGASPDVLGQSITIDGEPRTVVGVMPPHFQYPPQCEAWTAARYPVPEHVLRPDLDQSNVRDSHYFFTIGRLRAGVAPAQAQAEANTIAHRLKQQYGNEEEAAAAAVVALRDDLVGETRPALLILLGAVGLLLVIACSNVANILLARGAARQKEIAARDPWPFMAFVVRTKTEPAAAASAVESAIHEVDKDQPVYGVRTMREVVSASLAPRRARTLLLGLFALLALALACVGIYGVMAYSVAQRAHEVGIRMALGAGKKDVLGLIVGQGLRLALAGVAIALVLAAALSRLMSSILYGVGAMDAPTLAAASLLLIAVAALASYLPAWRATKVDPVVSLRLQ